MPFRTDYYEILQISHQADFEVVQAAYRSLGKKNHPDRGGDEAKMKLINEAHDVLNDKTTRQQYDQWLEAEAQKSKQQRTHQYAESTGEGSEGNNNPTEPQNDESEKVVSTKGSMSQWIFSKHTGTLIGILMILCAVVLCFFTDRDGVIVPLVGAAGMVVIYLDTKSILATIAIIYLVGLSLNGIQYILL